MHETLTQSPAVTEASDGIEAAALRAEAWAGEPFLRGDEDVAGALRPGTALRLALDSALGEIEAGLAAPSSEWRVRFGLMLGLERVLSEGGLSDDDVRSLAAHGYDVPSGTEPV